MTPEQAEALLSEAREALEPFSQAFLVARRGHVLDDDKPASLGMAWRIGSTGETRTLTWGDFHRARTVLSRLRADGGE